MPLREFTDEDGREWKVWDILPEQMDDRTRAEDFLQNYLDGWLVFESADGREKCRLHPIPPRWTDRTEAELRVMLHAAEPVRGERPGPGVGALPDAADAASEPVRAKLRTFRYPGGRYWTVREWPVVLRGASGEVIEERTALRFTSGGRWLDLMPWPKGWADYSDSQLADLLYSGFPRDPSQQNPTAFARRRGEPEAGPPRE
jgi:hypothetical protein